MTEICNKRVLRVFYSVLVVFLILFLALTIATLSTLPTRDHRDNLNAQVIRGKTVWETNHCIGCHTLLGEGAYYAPELGNVYKRRGANIIKAWMKSMPTNAKGRRQMPQFDLSEEDLEALIAFLKWTSEINTANWPPNLEG